VARYREKDENDLAWNKTRRRITRELDTRIADFREDLLNKLLTDAWDKHTAALEQGKTLILEDEASEWVDAILRQKLRPVIEAELGADVDGNVEG
jgi:hypothetical protein